MATYIDDKIKKRALKSFVKMMKNQDIVKIKKEDDWYLITVASGATFKYKGYLPETCGIYEMEIKPQIRRRGLF